MTKVIAVVIAFLSLFFLQHFVRDRIESHNQFKAACDHVQVKTFVKNTDKGLGFVENADGTAFPRVYAVPGSKMFTLIRVKNDSDVALSFKAALKLDFQAGIVGHLTAYHSPTGWIGEQQFRPTTPGKDGLAYSTLVEPRSNITLYVPFQLPSVPEKEVHDYRWEVIFDGLACGGPRVLNASFLSLNENTYDKLADALPKRFALAGGRYCRPKEVGVDGRMAYLLIDTPYLGNHRVLLDDALIHEESMTKSNAARIFIDLPEETTPGIHKLSITVGEESANFTLDYRGGCGF